MRATNVYMVPQEKAGFAPDISLHGAPIPFSFVWVFVIGLRPGPPASMPYASALFNVCSILCQVAQL